MAGRGVGSEGGGESGRETPASDGYPDTRRDLYGDAEMSDRREGVEGNDVTGESEHRRTDHERQRSGQNTVMKMPASAPPLHKLHTTPIAPSRPHPSQNLIQLYGLQRIQTSVARRDPVTGEKINKLRKSYENKVKSLGFAGRNKAQANQNELQGLLDPLWDQEIQPGVSLWQSQTRDSGKQLGTPEAESDLSSKLDAAFQLLPGRLPAQLHKEWQNMLGLDDQSTGGGTKANTTPAVKPAIGSATARTAPTVSARASAPASPGNVARPERSGKKRSYQDSSFEGYDQGYDDDGYSTGGRDSAKRQKRKDFSSAQNSSSFTNNHNSVGVRSS